MERRKVEIGEMNEESKTLPLNSYRLPAYKQMLPRDGMKKNADRIRRQMRKISPFPLNSYKQILYFQTMNAK